MRKDGKPHKSRPDGSTKVTATADRLRLRHLTWEPLRVRLQQHLQACKSSKLLKGEASRIARYLGCGASQVHRWSCPVCEHDTEPNFSQGFALMVYLQSFEQTHPSARIPTFSYPPNHPAFYFTHK